MSILKQKTGRNSAVFSRDYLWKWKEGRRRRRTFYEQEECLIGFVYLLKLFRFGNEKKIYIVINLSNHRFDNSNQFICCRFFYSLSSSLCPWAFVITAIKHRLSGSLCRSAMISFDKSRFQHRCFFKQSVSKTQLKTAASAFVYKMTGVNTRDKLEPLARVNKTKTKLWNFYLGISTLSR